MSRYLLLFLLPIAVWPQASNSTIRGVVRDSASAVIPAATVKLTNTATNVARTTQTNEAGLYVFPSVIPGPYQLAAEFAGMQPFQGTLTVHTQQDVTVDVALQVAQAVTTVEVQDVTPMVNVIIRRWDRCWSGKGSSSCRYSGAVIRTFFRPFRE